MGPVSAPLVALELDEAELAELPEGEIAWKQRKEGDRERRGREDDCGENPYRC